MDKPEAKSFKQLTISVEKLPASMAQREELTIYAADRARLLLGCYRTGDANDPETYVAAVAATLAHFPEEVITRVTHPALGLPSKKSWLPTVKEVHDACAEVYGPIKEAEAREARIAAQLAARQEQDERATRKPTFAELKEKYGENWGINPPQEKPRSAFKAPSKEDLAAHYRDHGLAFQPKQRDEAAE